jgi:hypothetical protein
MSRQAALSVKKQPWQFKIINFYRGKAPFPFIGYSYESILIIRKYAVL